MFREDVKVSICCLVYNHEKYLRKCLDGFVKQKTNFKYEILIHDDASTDSSPDIIREYEEEYPDLIKPLYQDENQYSKGVRISWTYQYPRAKGKYIALCEGDDYWCDENKLQLQYDVMEKNPNASICVHKVAKIYENGSYTNRYIHGLLEFDCCLNDEQFFDVMQSDGVYPFHISSYFFRREYLCEVFNKKPRFFDVADVGDVPIMVYYASKGQYIYINRVMSCYRLFSDGSWNNRNKAPEKKINHYKTSIEWITLFDAYTHGKYKKYLDKIITWYSFHIHLYNKNYKEICKKQYRYLLKKENIKSIIFIYLMAISTQIMRLYNRLKYRIYNTIKGKDKMQ